MKLPSSAARARRSGRRPPPDRRPRAAPGHRERGLHRGVNSLSLRAARTAPPMAGSTLLLSRFRSTPKSNEAAASSATASGPSATNPGCLAPSLSGPLPRSRSLSLSPALSSPGTISDRRASEPECTGLRASCHPLRALHKMCRCAARPTTPCAKTPMRKTPRSPQRLRAQGLAAARPPGARCRAARAPRPAPIHPHTIHERKPLLSPRRMLIERCVRTLDGARPSDEPRERRARATPRPRSPSPAHTSPAPAPRTPAGTCS